MNRVTPVLVTSILAVGLTACSDGGTPPTTVTESVTATTTHTVTTTTTPTPTTPTPAPAPEPNTATASAPPAPATQAAATQAAAEPYVTECLPGTPGPALWSDGTTRYSEYCYQQLGGAGVNQAESSGYAQQSEPPAPTFVPDSADGYGPGQELPPLCVRFPDTYGPC